MKLVFDESDFAWDRNAIGYAEKAQKKHDEWLAEQPLVYGRCAKNGLSWSVLNVRKEDTHQARLTDITPIEKPECEHKRVDYTSLEGFPGGDRYAYICRKCEDELNPNWQAVK